MKKNLSENEIRPTDLLKGQVEVMMKDINKLLRYKDKFVNVSCPACNTKKSINLYKKYGLNYVECQNCKTIYINPRPTPDILEKFYTNSENYDYWNKYIFPASEQIRKEKIFTPRVDKVIKYCDKFNINKDSILEVGAGFGTFCETMKKRGSFKKIVGIEPTPNLANTCRKKGIEIIESTVEKVHFTHDELFDVVVNFEVIEHLFSPKNFILKCNKFLKKNGLFIVTCPNGKGFDIITLGTLSKTVDHEHLNYFNPESLQLLLESSGFRVLESLTPGKLDAELVRNEILAGNFDVSKQPFLKTILIDKWKTKANVFQKFLSKNMLSSNMWIIAQKK
jgi:2-polyprenyl-3-methyl-5-hydroxy-6-metoxy-1,4-benzoquinol methylase/ribosomal protein S27E